MHCKTFFLLLLIDATRASDNHLHFRKNHLEKIQKLILTLDDKIRDERLQYNINKEPAKISALSSGEIHKYEYLTGEKTLPPDESRMTKKVKFSYSPLRKTFEKQIKTIENQSEKQIKAIEEHGKQLVKSSEKDSSTLLKEIEIFENLLMKSTMKYKIWVNKLIIMIQRIISEVKKVAQNF